jgi:hypothetical protein
MARERTERAASSPRSDNATNELRARRTAEVCGKCGCALSREDHVWKDVVWRGLTWQKVPMSSRTPTGVRANAYRQHIAPVCERCHHGGTWADQRCPTCERAFSVRPGAQLSAFCCRRCAWSRANQQRAGRLASVRSMACRVCQVALDGARRDATTCSSACRQKSYRLQHAETAAKRPVGPISSILRTGQNATSPAWSV